MISVKDKTRLIQAVRKLRQKLCGNCGDCCSTTDEDGSFTGCGWDEHVEELIKDFV